MNNNKTNSEIAKMFRRHMIKSLNNFKNQKYGTI
jgi:hypothetical protein